MDATSGLGVGDLAVPAAALTSTMRQGMQAMLEAQTAWLTGMDRLMADWLRRRHEAMVETSHLLGRFPACRDMTEMWEAGHAWMESIGLCLAADLSGPKVGTARWANGAAESGEEAAHGSAATRQRDAISRPSDRARAAAPSA